jgi:hypothetical protein
MQFMFTDVLQFLYRRRLVTQPYFPLRRKIIYKIPCRGFAFWESARSSKWKDETRNVRRKFWVENKI